eukprot:GHVU01012656.1.p3 GENE.GHVU01012656.1~~GHVU01012656.1.p3  ORF type:complete len:105 (-),score=11.90 GHVU01012656.1:80-394(-)
MGRLAAQTIKSLPSITNRTDHARTMHDANVHEHDDESTDTGRHDTVPEDSEFNGERHSRADIDNYIEYEFDYIDDHIDNSTTGICERTHTVHIYTERDEISCVR